MINTLNRSPRDFRQYRERRLHLMKVEKRIQINKFKKVHTCYIISASPSPSLRCQKSSPIAKLNLIDGPWWRQCSVFLLLLRSSCEERIEHVGQVVDPLLLSVPLTRSPLVGCSGEERPINQYVLMARLKLLHVFYGHLSSASLFASESHYVPPQEEEFSKNTLINH